MEKATRERKRLGIAAWRVESERGKQVRKKGNMKTRDRKKNKKKSRVERDKQFPFICCAVLKTAI